QTAKIINQIGSAVGDLTKALTGANDPIESFKTAIAGIGTLVGGPQGAFFAQIVNGVVSIGEAFFEVSKKAAEAQVKLDLLSSTTGFKPETIRTLELGASKVGAAFTQVITGADEFSKAVQNAQDPTSKAAKIFADIGLSIDDGFGKLRDNDELF